MKIWAVANQKGGVGKTTTVVSLAGILSSRSKRVLIIDLDPHGSVSCYFGNDPDTLELSVYQLFVDDSSNIKKVVYDVMLDTKVENIKLLPASTALATLDRQLGTQQGKGLVLKSSLQSINQDFDYILIDCPPLLGILMVNALACCEHLLIPVQTEFLALKGLERMVNTIKMIIRSQKRDLPNTIIPTMFDRRTRAAVNTLEILRQQYGEEVWDSVIPIDTQFREASSRGLPLPLFQHKSRGTLAYNNLLDYLSTNKGRSHLKLVNYDGTS